ncbi:MAG: hypothetical protein HY907_07480 [Deltaproteobacteria bacterium]|nr:hypothetical protein [Deltaproteobacteria bacterium]
MPAVRGSSSGVSTLVLVLAAAVGCGGGSGGGDGGADDGSGFIRDEPCDPRDLAVGDDPWGDTFDGTIDELRISDWVP